MDRSALVDPLMDRATGAMLGLALGDALGMRGDRRSQGGACAGASALPKDGTAKVVSVTART
jgi:hypothetical protein